MQSRKTKNTTVTQCQNSTLMFRRDQVHCLYIYQSRESDLVWCCKNVSVGDGQQLARVAQYTESSILITTCYLYLDYVFEEFIVHVS